MSSKGMRDFHDEIQAKIRNLLNEFGEGKISNQQFNVLYERFNNQLEMALGLIDSASKASQSNDVSTIAVRNATTGKALGMAIYHHKSGTFIETLGNFDLAPELISKTLNEFSKKIDDKTFIHPITRKLDSGMWLVFMARNFTTAIVLFKNEPAPSQIRELERLLHDFEVANDSNLNKMDVDKEKLAKPFVGFVRKKLKS